MKLFIFTKIKWPKSHLSPTLLLHLKISFGFVLWSSCLWNPFFNFVGQGSFALLALHFFPFVCKFSQCNSLYFCLLHFLSCIFSFFHLASFAHVYFLFALLHILKCSTFSLASTPTLLFHIFWLILTFCIFILILLLHLLWHCSSNLTFAHAFYFNFDFMSTILRLCSMLRYLF